MTEPELRAELALSRQQLKLQEDEIRHLRGMLLTKQQAIDDALADIIRLDPQSAIERFFVRHSPNLPAIDCDDQMDACRNPATCGMCKHVEPKHAIWCRPEYRARRAARLAREQSSAGEVT